MDDKGGHGAPDWVIEIVSPSSKKMDYSKKQALYCDAGVREMCIRDRRRRHGYQPDYPYHSGAVRALEFRRNRYCGYHQFDFESAAFCAGLYVGGTAFFLENGYLRREPVSVPDLSLIHI